ncbi:MAG: Mur ligase family protein, partial [Proteobacteria bacterium]|nr:Mur ligase family protein [Pseudomonadota bacterium]
MSIHITDDSRNIHPGDIFVAIDGGHNFAANAVNSGGAALAVVQNEIAELAPDKQRIVPDTRIAYLEYGAEIRNQFRGRIVAITGSAGKTTTKEMLVAALAPQCRVYATRGNFNNTIGVARTLCDMDLDADVAVIELGMSHAGEIESLVSYVRPDIAAIINIYPMHIEFFPDGLPGIARAKSEIFSTDPKIAVISAGANHADILIDAANRHAGKTILFDGENKECVLAIVGALGYDTERAAAAIADFSPLAGRGKMHQLMSAHGSYTLIDESYSGQPESMKRAIKKLD